MDSDHSKGSMFAPFSAEITGVCTATFSFHMGTGSASDLHYTGAASALPCKPSLQPLTAFSMRGMGRDREKEGKRVRAENVSLNILSLITEHEHMKHMKMTWYQQEGVCVAVLKPGKKPCGRTVAHHGSGATYRAGPKGQRKITSHHCDAYIVCQWM